MWFLKIEIHNCFFFLSKRLQKERLFCVEFCFVFAQCICLCAFLWLSYSMMNLWTHTTQSSWERQEDKVWSWIITHLYNTDGIFFLYLWGHYIAHKDVKIWCMFWQKEHGDYEFWSRHSLCSLCTIYSACLSTASEAQYFNFTCSTMFSFMWSKANI